MNSQDKAQLDAAKELLDIQGRDGNWNYDEYMHGMYNGMALIIAIMENSETVPFKDAPKEFLYERNTRPQDQYVAGCLKNGTYDILLKVDEETA